MDRRLTRSAFGKGGAMLELTSKDGCLGCEVRLDCLPALIVTPSGDGDSRPVELRIIAVSWSSVVGPCSGAEGIREFRLLWVVMFEEAIRGVSTL